VISEGPSTSDLSHNLSSLIARRATPEELARYLFYFNIERMRATDPELARISRACAIPRRFDAKVIGILRDAPDDHETNERLLADLLSFSFVLAGKDGGYTYHDNTRDLLLEDWQAQENRDQFDQFNERLVTFYEAEYEKAQQLEQDLARVAGIVQKASQNRYVELSSIIEKRIIVPLLEALYHETFRSAEAGYDFFARYCVAYERNGRLTVCRSLLNAARDYLERLPPQTGQEPFLKWLHYWEARFARQLLREDEAEKILSDLRQTEDDIKLKLWVLSELGAVLEEQYKLREAHKIYKQELVLAEETREDPFNLPFSYSRIAGLHWLLNELNQAADKYRQAIQSAQDNSNSRMEAYSRLNLSGVLHDLGDWASALDMALEGLDLVRTQLLNDQDLHQMVASRFMSLLGRRDPRVLDTLFRECEVLQIMGDSFRVLQLRKEYIDLLRKSGQLRRAEKSLAVLRKDATGYADTNFGTDLLFGVAFLHEDRGRVAEAIDLYSEIIERAQTARLTAWGHAAALTNRAIKNSDRGHWQQAESDLREAQEKWKTIGHEKLAALTQVYLARALRQQGQLSEAQQLLDETQDCPDKADLSYMTDYHNVQGDMYRDQARWVEARQQYQEVLRINRSLDEFGQAARNLSDLAGIAEEQGQWEKAGRHTADANELLWRLAEMEFYEPSDAAREADEENGRGLRSFCEAHGERRENVVRARDRFRSASERLPDNFWYHLNLAYACAELEDWRDAAHSVKTALERGPEWLRSPILYKRLAYYRSKQGEALQAEGDGLLQEGRTSEALEKFTQAMRLVLESLSHDKLRQADLHSRLGLIYLELADKAKALEYFVQALQLHRDNNTAIPGAALGIVCHSLLRDVPHYWALDSDWKSFADQATTERLRQDLTVARKTLLAYLDQVYELREGTEEAIPVVTPILLQVGDSLVPKVDSRQDGGKFLYEDIPAMRERFEKTLGVRMPGVRARLYVGASNASKYHIMLDEASVAIGSVELNMGYCLASPDKLQSIGVPNTVIVPAINPVTGDTGGWVPRDCWDTVASHGLSIWTETAFIIAHLEAILRRNLTMFLGVQEVETLLAEWEKTDHGSALIATVLSQPLLRLRFARLLRELVKEQMAILAWKEILEVVGETGLEDLDQTVLRVRLRLKWLLPGNHYSTRRSELPAEWEDKLISWLRRENGRAFLAAPPEESLQLLSDVRGWLQSRDTNTVIVVRDATLRPFVRRLLESEFPDLMVLAHQELLSEDEMVAGEGAPRAL
jgi:tetratricopeptide (TPR) repeat protein